MTWVIAAGVGYLLGSLPFALLAGRLAGGIDLRTMGSGNVGATNLLRSTRWSVALAVLALDIGKGALAVVVGDWFGGPPMGIVAGLAAVVGHVYPGWLRFKGGKGVATAAGMGLALAPALALGAMVAFVAIVWRTRFVSLGSMSAAVLLPVLALATGEPWPVVGATAAAAALILLGHRDNLRRLGSGTERRLGRRGARDAPQGA
jgi:glycerol-3-phosphate acyltransferase PlsY